MSVPTPPIGCWTIFSQSEYFLKKMKITCRLVTLSLQGRLKVKTYENLAVWFVLPKFHCFWLISWHWVDQFNFIFVRWIRELNTLLLEGTSRKKKWFIRVKYLFSDTPENIFLFFLFSVRPDMLDLPYLAHPYFIPKPHQHSWLIPTSPPNLIIRKTLTNSAWVPQTSPNGKPYQKYNQSKWIITQTIS